MPAVALFQDVTRRDPKFAEGFAALGWALVVTADYDHTRKDVEAPAAAAFKRALELDPSSRIALSYYPYLLIKQWRWKDAIDASRRAYAQKQDKNGLRAMALLDYAFALYEPYEAMQRRARDQDPSDFWQVTFLGESLNLLGRHQEAADVAASGLSLSPNSSFLLDVQCTALAMQGRLSDARAIREQLRGRLTPGVLTNEFLSCASVVAQQGNDLPALRRLATSAAAGFPGDGAIDAYSIGLLHQQVGDFDAALTWCARAVDRHEWIFLQIPYWNPRRFTPHARVLFDTPAWRALWRRPDIQDWLAQRRMLAASLPH